MGGDYTAQIKVGPHQVPLNVILDTGSSALAIDGSKYTPDFAAGDKSTDLAQTDSFGDGSSWTGAVFTTPISVGEGADAITLPDANVAVAYQASDNMFRGADGTMGLAYAALDDAFRMPADTWATQHPQVEVRAGQRTSLSPFLTQLGQENVASTIISFLTRRSFTRVGPDPASDVLNQGVMVIGGGEEATDLYEGPFQTVRVLSQKWYCTNLKSIQVGDGAPVFARFEGPKGVASNSIIDSGTNTINLGKQMLAAVLSRFPDPQRHLLRKSIGGHLIDAGELDLSHWPALNFVLEGSSGDVTLTVAPENYWQVDACRVGAAAVAIVEGDDGLATLGLPVMNGYFTIFDGEADGGKGVVKFAKAKA